MVDRLSTERLSNSRHGFRRQTVFKLSMIRTCITDHALQRLWDAHDSNKCPTHRSAELESRLEA